MHISLCEFPDNIRRLLPDIVKHIEKFYPSVNVTGGDQGITLSSDKMSDQKLRRIAFVTGSNILLTNQSTTGRTQVLEMLLQ